jgi:AmmeMemoRadiSam system protein B
MVAKSIREKLANLSSVRNKGNVRQPAVAGMFYPEAPAALRRAIGTFLADAHQAPVATPGAIIAPHAGYIYSGPVAAEAFAAIKSLGGTVRRALVIGPSHYVSFRGIAAPSATAFSTPLGDLPVAEERIEAVAALPQIRIDDVPHAPEHALEVELPFLQTLFGALPIIPLVVGRASGEDVAEVLAQQWDDGTLLVVSSDLSHYHDYATAERIDAQTAASIESLDERSIGANEACGYLAIRGLLIEARRRELSAHRLDLRNSGDTAGDRRSVVGYGAWVFAGDA